MNRPQPVRAPRLAQRGFSLLELMIAAVITMLSALFMFQTLTVGETMKRSSSSSNDGLRSGIIAMDRLSYLSRSAGTGIAQIPGAFNCLLTAYDNPGSGSVQTMPPASLPAPFDTLPLANLRLAPVMAFDGGANPDVLMVSSGTSPFSGFPIPRGDPAPGDMLGVTNTMGLRQNDAVLLTRFMPDGSSGNCFLTQIQVNSADLDANQYITTNPVKLGGELFAPSGTLPSGQHFTLASLGGAPSIQLIGVRRSGGHSDLVMYDLLHPPASGQPIVIAENVIDFQVLYGVDTTVNASRSFTDPDYYGDGAVDQWVAPTGDWSSASLLSTVPVGTPLWLGAERQRRIKSLRFALITQDMNITREAPIYANNALTLFGALPALSITRTIGSASYPANARFQVFESIEPVRNLSGSLSPIPDALINPS